MNIRKVISLMTGIAGVALFAATSASAALPPGSVTLNIVQGAAGVAPGTVGAPVSTSLLADETTPVQFAPGVTPTFGGNVESTVYTDPTGLLFEYQFVANSTPTDTVTTFSPGTFLGPIEVGQSGPASGAASTVTYKSGGTVSFNGFDGGLGIPAGTGGDVLFIQTTSTSYVAGTAGLSDSVGGTAGVFVPAPEPSTIAAFVVMGFGILALVVRARRRTVFTSQMA